MSIDSTYYTFCEYEWLKAAANLIEISPYTH
jgi:hypothetical protein